MMITPESENLPIWIDNISSQKFSCINCSILLPKSCNNYGVHQNCDLDSIFVEETSSNSTTATSTTSSEWLSKALSSIFKLNYLNAFDTFKEDQVQENYLVLCQNCNQRLSNLYHLYSDFLECGKINSYLHKKLQRLDEIIDSHQQKSINCDLIVTPFFQIEGEPEDCDFSNDDEVEPTSSHNFSTVNNKSNNKKIDPLTTTTITETFLQDDGREPRIILTRLPKKYTRQLRTEKGSDDNKIDEFLDCNSPANYNQDDSPNDNLGLLLPKVKVEVEDNFLVEDDDSSEYGQSASLSDASNSSEEYQPRPVKKSRKMKRNTSITEAPNQTKRPRGRPPGKINSTAQKSNKKRSTGSTKKSVHRSSKSGKKSTKNDSAESPTTHSYASIKVKGLEYYMTLKTCVYMSKKTKVANPCWYCKKFFPTPADCFEHTKQNHLLQNDDNYIMCDRCSRICKNNNKDLVSHLTKCELIPVGEIMKKKYPCTQCSKSFSLKSILDHHMLSHSDDRPFQCDECPYRAKQQVLIDRHKFFRHTVHESTAFQCDQCDRVLKNKILLLQHKNRMHTPKGQEQYNRHQTTAKARKKEERRINALTLSTICDDCNLDCFSRLAFVIHRRSFHGDRMGDFVCELCGKEFTTPKALRSHKKFVHSEARPVLCQTCGKSFKHIEHLRKHDQATHSEAGRLEFNKKMRECNRRRKIRQNHLSQLSTQQQQQQISNSSCIPHQDWTITQ